MRPIVRKLVVGVVVLPFVVAGLPLRAQDGPPRGGPGGGGPPGMGAERKLVKQFDKNGDGRLDKDERKAARAAAKAGPQGGGGGGPGRRGGFGPPGGFGGEEAPAPKPGPRVQPADVKPVPADVPLYDLSVIRTIFMDFEAADWEAELGDFARTDVEIPATLLVDGKKYPEVGVSFRGASSLFMVPAGSKRSFNVSMDFVRKDQRLLGAKTLNLLNAHEDPTFLHTVLYSEIARSLIPAPKASFVRVVVNGESWGLYVAAQQFDKIFVAENFGEDKGARWKVKGSPRGRGGLEYTGDDVEEYKARFDMKSGGKDDWAALVKLCKTLNKTPPEELEAALEKILDVEGALKFLALDVVLANGDGYWTRASDYSIYRDAGGVFHVVPHDMNESFQPAMMFGPGGPGGRGGRGGRGPGGGPPPGGAPGGGPPEGGGPPNGPPEGGVPPSGGGRDGEPPQGPPQGGPQDGPPAGGRAPGGQIDPLVGLTDETKPLRSKLLAVPAFRTRYLKIVRDLAADQLDWAKLGPTVKRLRALIEKEVEADTRKLSTYEAFKTALADPPPETPPAPAADPARGEGPRGPRPTTNLRAFVEARRKFLLEHPEIKKLD